ncbi:MAG: type II toxin-antitoxin system VapC family toxin [Ancalomicrobiaceae bacterium]|nr:type II toxin-antitoxin system VapC family toxin [Ancalomicrobiaceae bacterium]
MNVLLDTHALLWWMNDDPSLSMPARDVIAAEANTIYVSAASAWEIAIKFKKGKLPTATYLLPDFSSLVEAEGFVNLPISAEHMIYSVQLPGEHRDPFDRIIAAQAILESMQLISIDAAMTEFGAFVHW